MTLVTINHVRAAGICCRGARAWFAAKDELSWSQFLDRGYDADVLRVYNCPIANRAIAVAEQEAADGG